MTQDETGVSTPKDNVSSTPQITVSDGLRLLASANFSSDSINEQTVETINFTNQTLMSPLQPTNRRYSNNSTTSPKLNARTRRPRPVSAFLLDSSNSISEDGTPIQFDNTPRSRNSMTFGNSSPFNYNPTFELPMPPPLQPPPPLPCPPAVRSTSPVRAARAPGSPIKNYSPFNFQPQEVNVGGAAAGPTTNGHLQTPSTGQSLKPAHRKGHKYKHSSVSMNFFQEPPPVEIQTLGQIVGMPDHFPVPTFKETIKSITHTQKLRLGWACFHIGISVIIFLIGFHYKLPSLSTLAHLVFYDAIGSSLIVVVDIMSNFDVWNTSSITYPFGLGRVEVLAGFALSSWLIMVGFDLFSHLVEEAIFLWVATTNDGHDEHGASHHIHAEVGASTNWIVYEAVLALAMVVCLVSSNLILSYDRISEMMSKSESVAKSDSTTNKGLLSDEPTIKYNKLKKILQTWRKNPTHLVTITYTIFLALSPVIPQSLTSELAVDINEIGTFLVATFLCYNGWKLVKSLGGILLCSFPYSDHKYHLVKAKIMSVIEQSDFFRREYTVDRFFITKFNYRVFVVGMKISMNGADADEEIRVRFEVNRIITRELEKLEGSKVSQEITIDIDRF